MAISFRLGLAAVQEACDRRCCEGLRDQSKVVFSDYVTEERAMRLG